jgi:hypothetical protein
MCTISLPTWNQKTSPIGINLEKKSQPHFKTYGYNNYCVSHSSIWNFHQITQCCIEISYTFNVFPLQIYENFQHLDFLFFIFEFNNKVGYFRSGVLTCKWYIWKKLQVLDEIDTNQQISLTLKVYQICLTLESSNMCFYVMTLTLGF